MQSGVGTKGVGSIQVVFRPQVAMLPAVGADLSQLFLDVKVQAVDISVLLASMMLYQIGELNKDL